MMPLLGQDAPTGGNLKSPESCSSPEIVVQARLLIQISSTFDTIVFVFAVKEVHLIPHVLQLQPIL
jgi:hypothetical protein